MYYLLSNCVNGFLTKCVTDIEKNIICRNCKTFLLVDVGLGKGHL